MPITANWTTGKWTVYYNWTCLETIIYKTITLTFKADGTFSGKDMGSKVSGTWSLTGSTLIFQFNDSWCIYSGYWPGGKSVTGTMATFDDEKLFGDFYMLMESHLAHTTKKSELSKSSIHHDAIGRQIKFK
jgi:hypothetical protein